MDFLSAIGQPLQAFMNLLDVPQDIIQGAQARGRQYADQPFVGGALPTAGFALHEPTGLAAIGAGLPAYVQDIMQRGWEGANDHTAELSSQQPDAYPGEKLIQGFVPNAIPALAAFTNPISGVAEGTALAARMFPSLGSLGRVANATRTAADLSYLPYAAGMAGDLSGRDDAYGVGALATLAALRKAPRLSPKLLAPVDAGLDLYRASKVQQPGANAAAAKLAPAPTAAETEAANAVRAPLSDEERARFLRAAMGTDQ